MGIFNANIFKELKEGLENFSEKVKKNFNEGKEEQEEIITKCPNSGANVESGEYKCKYCNIEIRPNKDTKERPAHAEKRQYPVLVSYEEEDGGFYAHDCQTDTSSDCHKTVAAALEDITKELQKILDDGDGFKFWTEEELSKKFYAKGQLKRGAKIKFVELEYIDPEKDPDW